MLGIICRFRYFMVGPFILEGVVGKTRKVWICTRNAAKALSQEASQER